ncbi:hypothetical protein [Actinoallomurus sp. NPDC052274]|uniref:hypothetical protein n=1 Tax=Actinoallomurus sp. NPDC052274 TaxID=3155420 RepID=UPI00342FEAF8
MYGAVLVSLISTRVGSQELAAKVAAGDLTGDDAAVLAAGFTYALHIALYGTAAVCLLGTVAIAAAPARPRRDITESVGQLVPVGHEQA